jgi:hypothetical protein
MKDQCAVKVTKEMIERARRAEFDHYQRGGLSGGRFIPTPDSIIRAMLEAALSDISSRPVVVSADAIDISKRGNGMRGTTGGLATAPTRPAIVTAYKPRRR